MLNEREVERRVESIRNDLLMCQGRITELAQQVAGDADDLHYAATIVGDAYDGLEHRAGSLGARLHVPSSPLQPAA